MKTCKACNISKPLAEFRQCFYKAVNGDVKIYAGSECLVCFNAKRRKNDRIKVYGPYETKTCKGCGKSKPVYDFGIQRSNIGGRRHKCKKCETALKKANHHPSQDYMRMTHIVPYLSLQLVPESARSIQTLQFSSESVKIYSDL